MLVARATNVLNEDPEKVADEYVKMRYGEVEWRFWPEVKQVALTKDSLQWKRSQQPTDGLKPIDKVITSKDLGCCE
jgi:hypothetical protein